MCMIVCSSLMHMEKVVRNCKNDHKVVVCKLMFKYTLCTYLCYLFYNHVHLFCFCRLEASASGQFWH